ncbi:hypothetical protein AAZX31_06G272600 [Glycine max]
MWFCSSFHCIPQFLSSVRTVLIYHRLTRRIEKLQCIA